MLLKKNCNNNGKETLVEGLTVERALKEIQDLSEEEAGGVLEEVELPEKIRKELEKYAKERQS